MLEMEMKYAWITAMGLRPCTIRALVNQHDALVEIRSVDLSPHEHRKDVGAYLVQCVRIRAKVVEQAAQTTHLDIFKVVYDAWFHDHNDKHNPSPHPPD